jgi:hypothetical protein
VALTRAEILELAAKKRPVEAIKDVPELGDGWIRTPSGTERDAFDVASGKVEGNYRGRLMAMCWSDKEGNRLFTDADAPALGQLAPATLEPIVKAAMRVSGMSAEEVKELEKNSETAQSGGSGSDSPAI